MDDEVPDISVDDAIDARRLSPEQAYALFGLPLGADRTRVRARYRRLAFLHHPDRNGASPQSFARFRRISRAYQVLTQWLQTDAAGEVHGQCARCDRPGVLYRGLDGRQFCRDCLVWLGGRRYLPAPPMVIASCGFAIVALTMAVVGLIIFLATSQAGYVTFAAGCGGAALVFLAVLSIMIGQVARPRKRN